MYETQTFKFNVFTIRTFPNFFVPFQTMQFVEVLRREFWAMRSLLEPNHSSPCHFFRLENRKYLLGIRSREYTGYKGSSFPNYLNLTLEATPLRYLGERSLLLDPILSFLLQIVVEYWSNKLAWYSLLIVFPSWR